VAYTNLADRIVAAVLLSAIGDALGWATEFLDPAKAKRLHIDIPIRDYVRWEKLVGGRWWGYLDEIAPGEYSDDTQLALAVARSISQSGSFEPERFAYLELPLWLHYERGGGKSIKAAARNMISHRSFWFSNFYRRADLEYREAGANGVAMRSLPLALVNLGNGQKFLQDSFFNAIVTHGHPRAILGAILFGLAVREALRMENGGFDGETLKDLGAALDSTENVATTNPTLRTWMGRWEGNGRKAKGAFLETYAQCVREAHTYLDSIPKFVDKPPAEYYKRVGALDPATKGSGLSTVCAAIYLFTKETNNPENALFTAVNLLGSDTDTIANFLGALLGARYGSGAIPRNLAQKLQDSAYLTNTAERLFAIATGKEMDYSATGPPIRQDDAYVRILAWEIGMHEMFWDAIEVGGTIVHPALGRGRIIHKRVEKLRREGFVAKLLHVKFDCGQTCTFHSRVEDDNKVSQSLTSDIERTLRSEMKRPTTVSSLLVETEM
jgi:ADP-ribosylglycohydrolase